MTRIKFTLMAVVIAFTMVACETPEGSALVQMLEQEVAGLHGSDGATGLSAYEIAVEGGFAGTEEEWLESLRGAAGVQGIEGLAGLSAYQLWVIAGNEGSEGDFLASLIGADGTNGVCPDCGGEVVEPEPIPTDYVRVTIQTSTAGLSDFKVGHLLGMGIVTMTDIEGDGNILITSDINVSGEGEHMVGYQFTK